MSTSSLDHLPLGAVALPGMIPKKPAPNNSKTEHVVERTLPKTPETSTFQSLKEFKSLKKLSNKRQKDTIYFSEKKGEFTVDKKKNGFIEFFKAVIFFNFFRYTLSGFSKDKDTVYKGLDNLFSDLPTLKDKAESNTDVEALMETVNKMNAVFEVIHRQSILDKKHEKAGSIENLQTKIATFLHNTPLNSAGQPSAFSLPSRAMIPLPPIATMKKTGGMPLDLSGAKLSSGSHQVQEASKPLLPELATYTIPAVKRPGSNLGEFQATQSLANSRDTLFRDLTEDYQKFIQARKDLLVANKEMEQAAAKLEHKETQALVGQSSQDGPPPPPPPPHVKSKSQTGGPPPPPPNPQARAKINSKPQKASTWKEKQFDSYKNKKVIKNPIVSLFDKIYELEKKHDFALKQVVETLFPEIKGLSFKTDKEVQTLDRYVKAYNSQAKEELKMLNETIERTNPFNKPKKSSPSRMDRVEPDQPQVSEGVRALTKILKNIEGQQKMIAAREKKIERSKVDKKMIIEEQNKLATEMFLKKMSSSSEKQDSEALQTLKAREKAQDSEALQTLKAREEAIVGDIETSRKAITNHEKNIAGFKITLASEVKMQKLKK